MQEVIVIMIGIAAFGYAGWRIYKTLTRKSKSSDRCAGCSGCALKDKIDCEDYPKRKK